MGSMHVGARDTTGFTDAVRGGFLPQSESITYCGVFSENKFSTGPKEKEMTCNVNIECGTSGDDAYVALYCKSKCDGEPRGPKPIDVAILVDTSGSMTSQVGGDPSQPESQMSRLALCKVALAKLIANLRPDDRIGVAEFKNQAKVVFPCAYVKDLDTEEAVRSINALEAWGGTTVPAGMDCGIELLTDLGNSDEPPREKRIMFLTDMDTMGRDVLKEKLEFAAGQNMYTSIIGIGIGFDAALTEMITKVTGANYFCITKGADVEKKLVIEFHWNFFPCSFDVRLQIQSSEFTVVDMFGTPFDTFAEDAKEMRSSRKTNDLYPEDFKKLLCAVEDITEFSSEVCGIIVDFFYQPSVTVNNIDTVFPSFASEDGRTEGGLILVKLQSDSKRNSGRVRVHLTSIVGATGDRETIDQVVDISRHVALGSGLHKGIVLQKYAQACRRMVQTKIIDEETTKTLVYMKEETPHFSEEDQAEILKAQENFENLIKVVQPQAELNVHAQPDLNAQQQCTAT